MRGAASQVKMKSISHPSPPALREIPWNLSLAPTPSLATPNHPSLALATPSLWLGRLLCLRPCKREAAVPSPLLPSPRRLLRKGG